MDTFQTLKELQNIHSNVQKITIGIFEAFGEYEFIVEDTVLTLQQYLLEN